jgi:hypothetical protein
LDGYSDAAIQWVIAHELAHVASGLPTDKPQRHDVLCEDRADHLATLWGFQPDATPTKSSGAQPGEHGTSGRAGRFNRTDQMSDDTPWYAPGHRQQGIPRQRRVGEEVWRLRHPDGRVQSCELHDDSAVGAGVDVLVVENGEPLFSRRCLSDEHAVRRAGARAGHAARRVDCANVMTTNGSRGMVYLTRSGRVDDAPQTAASEAPASFV